MWELVCGMEVHLQMNTQSKMFAPDSVDFGSEPNSQVSYITAAHPGTLPFINKEAIKKAVMLGLVCNCEINPVCYFDRKNYFYPDLPKGFQTTQDNQPICLGGHLTIKTSEGEKVIRINRIHMEEDAGKSSHDLDPKNSLIDLNRAGTPLMELVTEPDIRSAEEAVAFAQKLRQLARYIEVCDGNMQEGSLRFDANISIRKKGSDVLGTRAEVKNLNSFRFLKKAMEHEFNRQVNLLEDGEEVLQQTRGFDPNTGKTFNQRSKEEAHDYRYFPEPDLPAMHVSDEFIEICRQAIPALPEQRKEEMVSNYGLSQYAAEQLAEDKSFADFFEATTEHTKSADVVANWLINDVRALFNNSELNFSVVAITPLVFAELVDLVVSGKVNSKSATEQMLPELLKNNKETPTLLAERLNLVLQTDQGPVLEVVNKVLEAKAEEVKRYQNGAKQLLGLFMGEIMKESKGKFDPKQAKKILLEKLNV